MSSSKDQKRTNKDWNWYLGLIFIERYDYYDISVVGKLLTSVVLLEAHSPDRKILVDSDIPMGSLIQSLRDIGNGETIIHMRVLRFSATKHQNENNNINNPLNIREFTFSH